MEENGDLKPVLLKDLCRVCSTDSETLFPLSENDHLTEMGQMFVDCLQLNILSSEGYPDKICNYCQLQLNMFHAFITKANKAHQTFTELLETFQEQEDGQKADDEAGTMDMDAAENIDDSDEYVIEEDIKRESIDNDLSESASLIRTLTDTQGDSSGSVDETAGEYDQENQENNEDYNVEYLDLEYINSFEKELNKKSKQSEPRNKKRKTSSTTRLDRSKDTSTTQNRRYPFECTECNRRFVHKDIYEGHLRVHEGLPAFSCPHCPKTFNDKPNFDYHMQDHNNHRPAQCHLCEKSFKNKQDLNSHLRVHNDIRKYMCDVCGTRFRSQSHMVYHRYSHFEERNFHCDQCTQSFKSPHILKTHKNTIHSDIFRYECLECGKKFKRDHHLAAHKRTHEEDRPRRRKTRTAKQEPAITVEYIDDMNMLDTMTENV